MLKNLAKNTNQFFITKRWFGGTLNKLENDI